MALVPAANGVDAIIAGYGIQALDEGNNRFSVALNVSQASRVLGPVIVPDEIPEGESAIPLNADGPIQSPVTGLHMIEGLLGADAGAGGGEGIVIGPQDRISFAVTEIDGADEITINETTIPITPRAAGAAEPFFSSITAAVFLEAGRQYNYYIYFNNTSGTLELNASTVGVSLFSFTANQQPLPPPAALMRAARRIPRALFRRR